MRELRMEDTASFCNFMRMEPQMFDELVDRLSLRLTLKDTNWRKALEPGLEVAVALRYLASGDRCGTNWWPFTSVAIALRYRCLSSVNDPPVLTTVWPRAWPSGPGSWGSWHQLITKPSPAQMLNKLWFIICEVRWYSPRGNFTRHSRYKNQWFERLHIWNANRILQAPMTMTITVTW